MNQTKLHLIGIDPCGEISNKAIERIRHCRALVCSQRHRNMLAAFLDELPAIRLIPIAPVQEALTQAGQELEQGEVAVLASGDPLFFGIGRTLLHIFAPARIEIMPALSSMQLAFSRFKIPWDDAGFVSLHGREHAALGKILAGHDKLFLFTDQHNTPARIARALLAHCGSGINAEYLVHVAENLGTENERLHSGSLAEIAGASFAPLNVMLLVKTGDSPLSTLPPFGLPEEEIVHSRGLITKNEVRAATLHALRLPRRGIFWDVGAGSGAIGLEAARLFPELQVFAVERKGEEIDNIQHNRQRFQAWNLHVCPGTAPEAMTALPAPNRVFIGGSGGKLQAIVGHAARNLLPGGRIVINAVLEKTAQEGPKYLHEQGLEVAISEIRVTRKSWPDQSGAEVMHPITMIVGRKK